MRAPLPGPDSAADLRGGSDLDLRGYTLLSVLVRADEERAEVGLERGRIREYAERTEALEAVGLSE